MRYISSRCTHRVECENTRGVYNMHGAKAPCSHVRSSVVLGDMHPEVIIVETQVFRKSTRPCLQKRATDPSEIGAQTRSVNVRQFSFLSLIID
jgi:hypothetical protein